MATGKQRTPNFKFVLPRFNQATWNDDYYDNMRAIDGILSRFFGIANYVGIWQNSTVYSVGDRVLDAEQALIFEVTVQHTTDPEPATFQEFRKENPSFYEVFTTDVAFRGEWQPNTDYASGDFVLYTPDNDANKFAQVTTAYQSSSNFDNDVSNGNLEVLLSATGLDNTEIASLESLTTTGLIVRRGVGNHGTVEITFNGDGVKVTNGNGVSDNPTLSLTNDLDALEGLSSTGFAVRSNTDTWAQRSITTPNPGISVSNGDGVAANPSVIPSDDLAAVESLSSNGIAVRTGSNAWAIRNIAAGDGINVTNPDGVSGNPSVAVDSTVLRDSDIGTNVQGYADLLADLAGLTVSQGDVLYVDATGTLQNLGAGTSGQVLQTQGAGANPAWADGAFEGALLHVQDQKPSGTDGGSSVSGDQDRDLNTVVTDEIGVTISSPEIQGLPAGDYYIEASAPGYYCNRARARLFNVTTSSNLVLGTTEYPVANGAQTRCHILGRFTLSQSSDLKIIHYTESSRGTNGLGVDVSDGNVEIYTEVRIWKVG